MDASQTCARYRELEEEERRLAAFVASVTKETDHRELARACAELSALRAVMACFTEADKVDHEAERLARCEKYRANAEKLTREVEKMEADLARKRERFATVQQVRVQPAPPQVPYGDEALYFRQLAAQFGALRREIEQLERIISARKRDVVRLLDCAEPDHEEREERERLGAHRAQLTERVAALAAEVKSCEDGIARCKSFIVEAPPAHLGNQHQRAEWQNFRRRQNDEAFARYENALKLARPALEKAQSELREFDEKEAAAPESQPAAA